MHDRAVPSARAVVDSRSYLRGPISAYIPPRINNTSGLNPTLVRHDTVGQQRSDPDGSSSVLTFEDVSWVLDGVHQRHQVQLCRARFEQDGQLPTASHRLYKRTLG